jgi:microcompartment protein CcmL/EutN
MQQAIGMLEYTSIARGLYSLDQMVKIANVEVVMATATCPGKYIALVTGEVSAVESAIEVGEEEAGEYIVDSILIPNVTPSIFSAIVGTTMPDSIEAVGIIESFSLSTMVIVADAVLKAANVAPLLLRLGNGLGGKAYFSYTGDVAAVKYASEVGAELAGEKGLFLNAEVIPSPSEEIINSLL